MDLTSIQYQLSQAGPLLQALLAVSSLVLIALSTWFWSVTLDRLFDLIGERFLKLRIGASLGERP